MTSDLPTPANHNAPYVVAALYEFASLPDYADHQPGLLECCRLHGISGTLLLASEGINGTIAGSRAGIDAVLCYIRAIPGLTGLEWKESHAFDNPFYRMKVRLKREIVTMGVDGIDPNISVGTYVEPEDWNALISDPDTIVVDTRNDYEVDIGTFQGAIDPKTKSFRDFPDWFRAREDLSPEALAGKKLAMFCTGGIRCEKSTAFAKQLGLDNVFHLKGGILKYLEAIPAEDSLWEGDCFVFDQRVAVGHGLEIGAYDLCRACRRPIDADDMASPDYIEGVQCPHCVDEFSDDQRARFAARHKQIKLAEKRGEAHIGATYQAKRKPKTTTSMTETDHLPVLYSFRRCPYAMRARLALAIGGQQVRLREIVLRDKPAEMLAISPKGTVPVLQLRDGRVIDESLDVMLWALGIDDPAGWLAPDRDAMMALIAENDGPFKRALDRYKYPSRYEDEGVIAEDQRDLGVAFLQKLDGMLAAEGQLFGENPSLADAAIFPFVRQFANTDRDWFDAQALPHLQAWLAGHLDGVLFKSIMPKFAVWKEGEDEPVFPS